MLLGRLIKDLLASGDASVAAIEGRDIVLAARVREAAARRGCAAGDYIADALRSFLAGEDAEIWTTAVSRAQDSDEPGFAFMDAVLRHRLAADGA